VYNFVDVARSTQATCFLLFFLFRAVSTQADSVFVVFISAFVEAKRENVLKK
jgi:hypothetical protein